MFDQGRHDLVGKPTRAPGTGDVAIARTPEGQSVDRRFAQDHVVARRERRPVEQAPMRTRQVEMIGRALAQIVPDLAAVEVDHDARPVADRHHQAPAQMLMAAVAQHAEPLELAPHVCARLAVLLRQTVAQGAIGKAKAEGVDQIRMGEATLFQIGQRLRVGTQRTAIIVRHIAQQRAVLGRRQHRQLGDGRSRDRGGVGRGHIIAPQQFDCMTEADAFAFHDPVYGATTHVAAEAVEQILRHRHHQRRRIIVMEGALRHHVAAAFRQLHARCLDQPDQANLCLQPLYLRIRYACHGGCLQKAVKGVLS
ncbi:hypothetical protein EBBID32_14980 [Sphingobium indicum BiD32]|uniref:Uncharacterized protein n=1 Tax=Sphingobium indicum BiD32 TaxID=1301087 RepID=N1MKB4_9SPHN|nr:hypothetical protein EBBID32_14980 [Sphingobium indicum BiD32]